MIQDWREKFQTGDFPFIIQQLAAFQPTHPTPRENNWAEIRESQAYVASTVPNTGLAVAIDIGDANDIHPKNKRDVGKRLAYWALANTYGKREMPFSGPVYKSLSIVDGAIRLDFDHDCGGLNAKSVDGVLSGFAIAGEDGKFVWAKAVIQDDTVLVYSPDVPNPVAVRYAWDINPVCNLFNGAGLPAVPFRTDDWPMITRDKK
jgi:sialate O-acetylesterase